MGGSPWPSQQYHDENAVFGIQPGISARGGKVCDQCVRSNQGQRRTRYPTNASTKGVVQSGTIGRKRKEEDELVSTGRIRLGAIRAIQKDGKLKQMYQHAIRKSRFRMKVVKRSGRTLKSQLQTSDPFRAGGCGRGDCFVCTTTGKGNCMTESVTYRLKCLGEGCSKNVYKGETAGNGYTRGGEHLKTLASHDVDNSPLWKHLPAEQGGEKQSFEMSVTWSFQNNAMLQQITEAVQINNSDRHELMNDQSEWNMNPVITAR